MKYHYYAYAQVQPNNDFFSAIRVKNQNNIRPFVKLKSYNMLLKTKFLRIFNNFLVTHLHIHLHSVMVKFQNQHNIVIMFVDCCLRRPLVQRGGYWNDVSGSCDNFELSTSAHCVRVSHGAYNNVRSGYLSAHLCFGSRLSVLLCVRIICRDPLL